MESSYTTAQVAALSNVSVHTLHRRCEEFADYLSEAANPLKGRQRSFNADDLGVLLLVAQMKQTGFTFAEIKQALDKGERASVPDTSPSDLQTLVAVDNKQEVQGLIQRLEALSMEIQELRGVRDENIRLQTELAIYKARAGEADNLREQIGELRGELKALRRQTGQE